MSKNKSGKKLKKSITLGNQEISKYKKIQSIDHVQGRPGEDFYEVTDEDGNKKQIDPEQKKALDKLIKKK